MASTEEVTGMQQEIDEEVESGKKGGSRGRVYRFFIEHHNPLTNQKISELLNSGAEDAENQRTSLDTDRGRVNAVWEVPGEAFVRRLLDEAVEDSRLDFRTFRKFGENQAKYQEHLSFHRSQP